MDSNEINHLVQNSHMDLEYGTAAVFLKKHEGKIFNIDVQRFHTHATPEGNKQVLTMIGTLIKGMQASIEQSKMPAQLTFTIDFADSGQAKKLIVQDTKKHRVA